MLRPPAWLKKRIVSSDEILRTKKALAAGSIRTVCESSLCPNLNECFSKARATFLILGPQCTRSCGFCACAKGVPAAVDKSEPARIRGTVEQLGLSYVVITSVTRDDLPDGGAGQFARAVEAIRQIPQKIPVEILVPDLAGDEISIKAAAASRPDIFSHNIETIERLYPKARKLADYQRSLRLLKEVKRLNPGQVTKSGIMVGLGETDEEVVRTMRDIRHCGCDIITIGQYLRPRPTNLPVERFVRPETFEEYKRLGEGMGFRHVSAGPFVRSSYYAEEMFQKTEVSDGKCCASAAC